MQNPPKKRKRRKKMSENEPINIEQEFLQGIKDQNISVKIYLVNGVMLVGILKSFDDYTILLSTKAHGSQLLYKHSITTISPYHE